jgi:SAM-dependent methyltransferase
VAGSPAGIDSNVPNVARVYDYFLGGAHNFAVDRELAARIEQIMPGIAYVARLNRSFLRRAVSFMVGNGIRQFLDIGSGIPTVRNVHEIAQAADPACRVVYVDKEPIAVEHSRILLRGNDRVSVIRADLRDPDDLLGRPEIKRQLDLDQPIGLLTLLVWHFVPDIDEPNRLMARYRAALARGSYLALTHVTGDFGPRGLKQAVAAVNRGGSDEIVPRDRARITTLFDGFELVPPGVIACAAWRPEGLEDGYIESDSNTLVYAGVGHVR